MEANLFPIIQKCIPGGMTTFPSSLACRKKQTDVGCPYSPQMEENAPDQILIFFCQIVLHAL